MQSPSQGISRELLPHVHLLSTYRFPVQQQVHHSEVAKWLLAAPKIARDQAPFYWNYLDRPVDGTILLTWQPLETMGTEFSTDGYIWPPAETGFQLEVDGGYVLEMYQHKSGYAPGESVATHARRRYRLIQKFPHPGSAAPDLAFWITHYSQAEPIDRVPSSMITITDPRTHQLIQTRLYLQSQGQLVQKEFMLHDRSNWPQIQFPRGSRPAYNAAPPVRTPQVMAYPPGPPTKRARTQSTQPQPSPMAIVESTVDDEEDTSRGDAFDHITPREISSARFMQNHEWMEEILSSPYAIKQIMPVNLGLELKGPLGDLNSLNDALYTSDTGRLDPVKAAEFRTRTEAQIIDIDAEMEKMKAKHAKRMARFKQGALTMVAEKELRSAVHDPTDVGPEYWRLEGRVEESEEEEPVKVETKVDDIVAQVEASLGRHTIAVQELRRLQDGGLEENVPEPSPPSQYESMALDLGAAGNLLDQFHTGLSSTSTSTPAPPAGPSPPAVQEVRADVPPSADVEMQDSSDWIVVPQGGISPPVESTLAAIQATTATPDAAAVLSSAPASLPLVPTSTHGSVHDASVAAVETTTDTPLTESIAVDPVDFGSLEDLDTAGDALAGYGDDVLGDDMDLGGMIDDSAFGDALHGVDQDEGEN